MANTKNFENLVGIFILSFFTIFVIVFIIIIIDDKTDLDIISKIEIWHEKSRSKIEFWNEWSRCATDNEGCGCRILDCREELLKKRDERRELL